MSSGMITRAVTGASAPLDSIVGAAAQWLPGNRDPAEAC